MAAEHELFSKNDMQSTAENEGQKGNWIREP